LTGGSEHAEKILKAALQAGFRESGALNILSSGQESATPMVAVRSMGLSFSSLIGYSNASGEAICNLGEDDLKMLLEIGNERFVENEKRIARFRELLKGSPEKKDWEDSKARGARKRREGLERREEMRRQIEESDPSVVDGVLLSDIIEHES
jgi:tRNA wybutosine-synthesizing protein 3